MNNAWQPKASFLSGIWPIVVLVRTIRDRDLHHMCCGAVRVRSPAIRCARSTRSPAPLPDAMSARRLEYSPLGFVAGCISLDWMSVPEMEVGAATSHVLAVATALPTNDNLYFSGLVHRALYKAIKDNDSSLKAAFCSI